MVCIYHSKDLDGICSGAIVKKKFPDAKMIGYDYGEPIPVTEEDVRGQDVVMVDVTIPMDNLFALSVVAKSFIYIDHHVSSIKEYNERKLDLSEGGYIQGVFRTDISACELTWIHFYLDEAIPPAVLLLGQYDTRRNSDKEKWEKEIMPFQYGMRLRANSLETFPSQALDCTAVDRFIMPTIIDGWTILQYQATQNEKLCRAGAFVWGFKGYRAICLNVFGANSNMFQSVYNEKDHDIMMGFFYKQNKWTFSIFTTKDDIDLSVLAKSMGGGGHKKAAGFEAIFLTDVFGEYVVKPTPDHE